MKIEAKAQSYPTTQAMMARLGRRLDKLSPSMRRFMINQFFAQIAPLLPKKGKRK